MRILAIISFLFSFSLVNANTDSLMTKLKSTKVDTTRFKILEGLTKEVLFSNQDSAELFSKQLLQEATSKNNEKWKGDAYVLLGNIKYIWADYDSAYYYFEQGLKSKTKLNDTQKMAALNSNLGTLLNKKGEYDKALQKFNRCVEIDIRNKDTFGIAADYNNIGIAYWNKGFMQKAIDSYLKSIRYAEQIENESLIGQGYNNIGIIYRLVKNYDEALEYHTKSAKIFETTKDYRNLASTYGNIGLIYEEKKDLKNARIYQEKALKISLDNNDKAGVAVRYNNLGVLYESMKDFTTSIAYHQKSLAIKEEIQDKSGITFSKANIGMLLIKLNDNKGAIEICNEALISSKEIASIEIEKVACGCLYEANKNEGNAALALVYLERERLLSDSLSSTEQASELAKKETAFRYQKIAAEDSVRNMEAKKVSDAQIKAQEEELKAERLGKYMLYGGLFLVIIFAVFIFNRFKITRKQKGIIEYQMAIVEEQHTEIKQSISYAKRIQDALLNEDDTLNNDIPEHFVLYKPKDVLSGDFYWKAEKDDWWYVCVGDCTGHGVPGALLTMLGVSYLNELISFSERLSPAEMLNRLRIKVMKQLGQSGSEGTTKDGMDISLLAINKKTMECEWSGANNPLWVFRSINNPISFGMESDAIRKIKISNVEQFHLLELVGDKQPIGIYDTMNDFNLYQMKLQKNDAVYLFSDGFPDQFGSDNKKKLKSSNFKKLIANVCSEKVKDQPIKMEEFFENWKGDVEQIDDVCIIGIKI